MEGYYLIPKEKMTEPDFSVEKEDSFSKEGPLFIEKWPDKEKGQLVIVPTPIGNRADISLRALSCLAAADLIACEDTRHSGLLLEFYGIKKPLISYHAHNEQERSEELLDMVKAGSLLALISDAGLPGVCDPGGVIIKKALERNIPFTVLPGPSAAVTAQVAAGLGDGRYTFRNFLPRKGKDRKMAIEAMESDLCQVFYEAPHRIKACIEELGELWPDRDFCLIREWTKKYEEIISFKGRRAKGLDFKEKGEFVVVLGPYEKSDRWDDERLVKRLQELESQGLSGKDIIKTLSSESGRKKNEIYSLREEFKKRRS